LKELKGVHSTVDYDEPIMEKEESSKQGKKIADIDADVEINFEKVQAEAYNLELDHHEKVLSMLDVNDDEPAGVEEVGMSHDEIRPLFEKHYNYNQAFLNEVNEGIKVPEKEVKQEKEVEVESSRREGESLEQEIAKKQKMEQETEELKKYLQIVPDDDDDDVYADATPLASKIPIINYKIHTERNIPYFKITRADGNHKLFLSFNTMLKNYDREDLESLWKIVKERFKKTEPKNYTNDYLLNTLKIMFEKPNVKANIFLLVEKMYPLTHISREQMVNDVRLEVKDKSEMSLELLRLIRRRLNEGYIFLLVEKMYPLTHFTLEQMVNDVRHEVDDESEMSLELLRLIR
nr:hypothetical protein [Tanacetum cinerariifolium]